MRIVLDLQACQTLSAERGIGRYSIMLAQAMARLASSGGRDHDLRIALNNNFPESVDTIKHAFRDVVSPENFDLFNVPRYGGEMIPDTEWRKRAGERIREYFLAERGADIVHISSLFEGWGDDSVASVGCGPIDVGSTAITLYDLIPLMRADLYLKDPRVRDWYYRKLQGLKNADLLLAISQFTADEAVDTLQLPAEQVINISSAIDSIFVPRDLSPAALTTLNTKYGLTRPFVMYTGGIDHRKNIEALIEAFGALPEALKRQYQLAVVCRVRDEDRARLNAIAKAKNLSPGTLVLTGYVPDDDLVSLYNMATLFVFPSLYEGFGLPLLEAMACGTPVIGSDNSSIPEVIGRKDALFNAASVESITDKLHTALTDKGMRESLIDHGLKQARLFSWEASADRTLGAFEALHARRSRPTQVALSAIAEDIASTDPAGAAASPQQAPALKPLKPRLAFISPLPPDQSGIAEYSAELLPELTRYYETDIIAIAPVTDSWARATCRIRTQQWFEEHADEYDRVLYHFGNSSFHTHMFALLRKHPGVVVLHDFFLGGGIAYLDDTTDRGVLAEAAYKSHGYPALVALKNEGNWQAAGKYPMNKEVLDDALGVIVHSKFAKELAGQWYGAPTQDDIVTVPFMRASTVVNRNVSRSRLGVAEDTFLVCSFGILGPTKKNEVLLDAWLRSSLGADRNCMLVFVGPNEGGDYGQEMLQTINASAHPDRIKITGFASQETYRDYLAAGDMAVQLRGDSRGETSGAMLDCLAVGMPTIINANGPAAHFPDDVLIKLAQTFSVEQLIAELTRLHGDAQGRRVLSERAIDYVRQHHHPFRIGQTYRDAIERFSTTGKKIQSRHVAQAVAQLSIEGSPSRSDQILAARAMALNESTPNSPRQFLIDVSMLYSAKTLPSIIAEGHSYMDRLLSQPRTGWRVEPVSISNGHYSLARKATQERLQITPAYLNDEEIDPRPGDCLLILVSSEDASFLNLASLIGLKNRGISIYFMVFDAIPSVPEAITTTRVPSMEIAWTALVTRVASGVIFTSQTSTTAHLDALDAGNLRFTPLKVGFLDSTIRTPESEVSVLGNPLDECVWTQTLT